MATVPLSLRGYAAHRKAQGLAGGSLQAVQRAIQAGRLAGSLVTVGGVKRIADPEAADREWAANTDLSRAPGYIRDMGGPDDEDPDGEGGSAMAKASAREKHWKAELAELNYKQRAGELVSAEDVAAAWAEICSTIRTKILGLPSRMKQTHADLTVTHLATLDGFIRETLEELARGEAV